LVALHALNVFKRCVDAVVAAGEEDGWEFHSKQQSVDIYRKRVGDLNYTKGKRAALHFCCFLFLLVCKRLYAAMRPTTPGIGVIHASAPVVRDFFGNLDIKSMWDEMFSNGRVVAQLDPVTR